MDAIIYATLAAAAVLVAVLFLCWERDDEPEPAPAPLWSPGYEPKSRGPFSSGATARDISNAGMRIEASRRLGGEAGNRPPPPPPPDRG